MRKQGCKKWALYVPQLVALLLVFQFESECNRIFQHRD